LSYAEVACRNTDRLGLRHSLDDAHKDVPIEVYACEWGAG
jgi:hypothetical protein